MELVFLMLLKSIGATLIITGTAVGAGMLAIPLVTASFGFLDSALLLIFCWALMLYTAMQILEVNLAFPRTASFSTMAIKTTGPIGAVITWISLCLLLFALTAAYITGGSDLLGNLFSHVFSSISPKSFQISHGFCVLIFTVFLGGFVFFGTRPVDYLNRVLMFIKLGAFFVLVFLLLPHVNFHKSGLITSQIALSQHFHHSVDIYKLLLAVPILMTSFGFHPVIPSIRYYIGEHPRRLRWIIGVGCTLPLVIYLLWELCTLCVLPSQGSGSLSYLVSQGGSVGEMVTLLENYLNNNWIKFFINLFTDIAITTSFLGVTLGLFDFLLDGLKISKSQYFLKFLVWFLMFLIPALVALFYPSGFVKVLACASVFVAVLLLILPAWMAYQHRKLKAKISRFNYTYWGLFFTFFIGVGVIVLALLSCL